MQRVVAAAHTAATLPLFNALAATPSLQRPVAKPCCVLRDLWNFLFRASRIPPRAHAPKSPSDIRHRMPDVVRVASKPTQPLSLSHLPVILPLKVCADTGACPVRRRPGSRTAKRELCEFSSPSSAKEHARDFPYARQWALPCDPGATPFPTRKTRAPPCRRYAMNYFRKSATGGFGLPSASRIEPSSCRLIMNSFFCRGATHDGSIRS